MKRLAILRHAKSDWDDPGLTDFDRPLNKRGRKAARAVGEELKRRDIAFDAVIASPATRVRETLERLAEGYGELPDVQFEPSLYMVSTPTLLALVHGLAGHTEAPLIVGHNPGLHDLVLRLTRDDADGLRARVIGKFPTAVFVLIDLPVQRWADVAPGIGVIRELIVPRAL